MGVCECAYGCVFVCVSCVCVHLRMCVSVCDGYVKMFCLFQRGWGALMWASQSQGGQEFTSPQAEESRREVVKLLLAAGADINQTANVRKAVMER